MFPYTKLDLYELTARNHFDFPQIVRIWSYDQDDGFGNLINTLDMCCADFAFTAYIISFLGYELLYGEFSPCQYGEH